jgi:hypothetical protein
MLLWSVEIENNWNISRVFLTSRSLYQYFYYVLCVCLRHNVQTVAMCKEDTGCVTESAPKEHIKFNKRFMHVSKEIYIPSCRT